jgi:transposase
MNEFNYTSKEIELYATLRREGLLNLWVKLMKLKHRNLAKNGKDLTGGFIHIKNIKAIAKQIEIPYHTLRNHLMRMYQEGWLRKIHTGYRVLSWKTIALLYNLEIKKLKIFAYTLKELTARITDAFVVRHIKSQVYKQRKSQGLSTQTNLVHALVVEDEYSLSVRQVSKGLGFKGAMSGSRRLKESEARGKVKVKRNSTFVCELQDFGYYGKLDENKGKCFLKEGQVFRRERSNVIPQLKHDDALSMLMKKANIMRKMKNELKLSEK